MPIPMHAPDPTRRRVLTLGAAAALAGSTAFAQGEAAPTPECHDGDEPTPRETEGPFFKPRSPERADLVEPGMAGRVIEVAGLVLTRACRPVARALIEVWQADDGGAYDERGFRLRGHLFTDDAGRYALRTIVPGLYPGRTRHIHVKLQAPRRPVLTTQLYFPDEPQNRDDGLFRRDLTMRLAQAGAAMAGRFDFVLDMR